MKEVFEQWTKTMEKVWTPWQQMMTDSNWLSNQESPFKVKWSQWMSAMKAAYDVNLTTGQTFMDQSEEVLFSLCKGSPLYNATVEGQIRVLWNGIKKAQSTQQEAVKEYLDKIESLLKESEEAQ